ncbi:hypothetical protein B7494_g228 [Chlorociboria aeruginascens]|nr:hypothetical protein B7494_g228 [Chlorociboria aeruginascens]
MPAKMKKFYHQSLLFVAVLVNADGINSVTILLFVMLILSQPQPAGPATPDFTSPNFSSRPAKGETSKQKVCEFTGCRELNPQIAPDGKLLCYIHMQTAGVGAAFAKGHQQPAPAPPLFREPVQLDGLKQLKRKRAAVDKKSSHDEASMRANTKHSTQDKGSSLSANIDISPSRHSARKSAFDPDVYRFTRDVTSSGAIGPQSQNTSNAESRASKPAGITPRLQSSPDYSPPPPINTSLNPWEPEMSPEESLSTQISRELKKTTKRNSDDLHRLPVDEARVAKPDQAANTIWVTKTSQPELTARNSCSTSETAMPTEDVGSKALLIASENPLRTPIDTAQDSSSEDVEMADVAPEDHELPTLNGVIDEAPFPHQANASRDTGASINAISLRESNKIIDTNIDVDQRCLSKESHNVTAAISTRSSYAQIDLETMRPQKAAEFDQSTLDSFLASQAREPDSNPSQLWGHVDPRGLWFEEHTPEWLEAKKAEIQSRGGRKTNFGKHLTAQVIKERRERGWGIHQSREALDDGEEAARPIKDLFDIKLSDMEPGLSDGQLVMKEKSVDENGKKRKKNAIKAFPVG